MTIEIKLIDKEKVEDLLNQEGDTVPLYLVAAVHFEPPRPLSEKEQKKLVSNIDDADEVQARTPFGMQTDYRYVNAVLLRVDEPCYYREFDGTNVFVLPADISLINYDMLNTIHIEHGAWAYRLEPRWWDPWDYEEDPLDDAHWFFKPLDVPKFNLEDKETH